MYMCIVSKRIILARSVSNMYLSAAERFVPALLQTNCSKKDPFVNHLNRVLDSKYEGQRLDSHQERPGTPSVMTATIHCT